MRIRSPFYLLLLLLSVAMFSIACSDSSDPLGSAEQDISGDNSMDAINLDQEYGGLSFSDEPDAFGDELLKAEAELGDQLAASEGDEDDLLREHPEFDRPDVRRTYVRILWGRLDGRPEGDLERTEAAFERVNWDGTLTVDGGVVALKKTILFERATDWRLPRDDRHSLGWKSMTGPHKDGILVCVISRPNDEGVVSGSVEFSTGPLTVSFDLAELDGLDESFATDIEGNSVSFMAIAPRPDACPHGFLGGYWKHTEDPEANGGMFRGRVMGAGGRLAGYIAGRWGINEAGERVFAGKYIGRGGKLRGLLHGVWEQAEDGEGAGHFIGRWASRNGEHRGVIRGRYASREDGGAGFFHGMWEEACR